MIPPARNSRTEKTKNKALLCSVTSYAGKRSKVLSAQMSMCFSLCFALLLAAVLKYSCAKTQTCTLPQKKKKINNKAWTAVFCAKTTTASGSLSTGAPRVPAILRPHTPLQRVGAKQTHTPRKSKCSHKYTPPDPSLLLQNSRRPATRTLHGFCVFF